MEYFVILTLSIPGAEEVTLSATVPAGPDSTRAQMYSDIRRHAAENFGSRFEKATVVFFSVEPNQLGTRTQ